MKTWSIIADSSCDTPLENVKHQGIEFSIAPLKIIVDQTEYVDDSSLDVAKMLDHLKHFKGSSSSACPSIEDFAEQMRKTDYSIVISITSGLSGTYSCACAAKKLVMSEYPEKRIHIVDSKATSSLCMLDILKLQEIISSGKDFDEVVKEIDEYNARLKLLFMLHSYDTLVKNGRMSPVAGLFAKALNIKAIATNSKTGTIEVIDKPRGETNAIKRLVEIIADKKDINGKPVIISHCFNPQTAQNLKQQILKAYTPSSVTIIPMRGLASYYAGEGGIIMAI